MINGSENIAFHTVKSRFGLSVKLAMAPPYMDILYFTITVKIPAH